MMVLRCHCYENVIENNVQKCHWTEDTLPSFNKTSWIQWHFRILILCDVFITIILLHLHYKDVFKLMTTWHLHRNDVFPNDLTQRDFGLTKNLTKVKVFIFLNNSPTLLLNKLSTHRHGVHSKFFPGVVLTLIVWKNGHLYLKYDLNNTCFVVHKKVYILLITKITNWTNKFCYTELIIDS